ncbi:MAG: GNAT family N-acetyltransferase, partial [Anaerolineales bacterium]
VRDFLLCSWPRLPYNWDFVRWNYARYFVAPLLLGGEAGIRAWEETIGLWENDEGEVVAVVNAEDRIPGQAFFNRHPDCDFLLEELLDYAETTFVGPEGGELTLQIYDGDEPLQALLRERGYAPSEYEGCDSEYAILEAPRPQLPPGYTFSSMAERNDIEGRREVLGRGFNHTDPVEWASASTYRELQKAPDYRKDLDLYVVAPNGEYASFCVAWYDELNKMGVFEPVGTHPDYRRRGLGTAVVLEGIRRLAVLGAEMALVGSAMPFYMAVGFKAQRPFHFWSQRFEARTRSGEGLKFEVRS